MPTSSGSVFAPTRPTDLVDHYYRVAAPRHPDARLLLDHWRACIARGGGFVVGRDIPARPIASVLQNVVLYEPLPDRSDMRVRLVGAAIRRRFGTEIKGSLLSELFSREDFEHHLASSHEAFVANEAIILDSSLKRGGVEEFHTEVLVLPVTARDLKTPWLLVGIFYFT